MGQPHSTAASLTHNQLLTPPITPSHSPSYSPSHSPRPSSPIQNFHNADLSHISRDISPLFRLIDPKTYDNILRNSKYQLPSDNEHIDRIQLRHSIFRYVWQGNFSSPVEEKLKNGAKVLDVG
jgi:hypothetical protein